jgi:hypothetical protein
MISEADDLRHHPTPAENFSESKWFSFYDAAQDLWISSRIGLEANRKRANRWLVVAVAGKVVLADLRSDLPLPSENWDDIRVGGLHYRTMQTMRGYALSYRGPELEFNVLWEAETPIFDYKQCAKPLPPSLAAEHYEQSGTIRGDFHIGGKALPLNGTGHRDHSWGIRQWEGFRSWIAFMTRFDERSYLHVERFDEQSSGISTHGFLYDGKENIPLRDATVDLTFVPGDPYPKQFRIELEDVRGQHLALSGEVRVTYPLEFGRCRVGESFGSFRFRDKALPGIVEYGFTR